MGVTRVGVIMLVHTALDRAAQVARHWAEAGSPVAIHCEARVSRDAFASLKARVADLPLVQFTRRRRCDWGTWSIVQATLDAVADLLQQAPDVTHVCLTSGGCLPLRPISELEAFLGHYPGTDFIESTAIEDVTWVRGGLEEERFRLRFPVCYKGRPTLFDELVALQRRLRLQRRMPDGLSPHLGSQWWCLTRQTLLAVLMDPERARFERYFGRTWIPDESYFQTLVRRHSWSVENRSLTLSMFDAEGKPHVFYDDHADMLQRSGCFLARKIWPGAEGLYRTFPAPAVRSAVAPDPDPTEVRRSLEDAAERRLHGRAGLYMQSRLPRRDIHERKSAQPYAVFQGFADVFEGFEAWLAGVSGEAVHGRLFAPDRAGFAWPAATGPGCLSDQAKLRDTNPCAFLTNLLWATRGARQSLMFRPDDAGAVWPFMVQDGNARITMITGAWAVSLARSGVSLPVLRREAAKLQRAERAQVAQLRAHSARARFRVRTLAEVLENPLAELQTLMRDHGLQERARLMEIPRLAPLDALPDMLARLDRAGVPIRSVGVGLTQQIAQASPEEQKARRLGA